MALGFIKKVFSFGKNDVEERPAEDAPLPPLNLDALQTLKPEQAPTEALARDEATGATVEPPPQQPAPAPAEPPTTPTPSPAEPLPGPAPVPTPAEPPAPGEVPETPPAEAPPEPEPNGIPAPTEPEQPAPTPQPEAPQTEPSFPQQTPAEPPMPPETEPAAPAEEPYAPEPIPGEPAPEVGPADTPTEIPVPTPPPPGGEIMGEAAQVPAADELRTASARTGKVTVARSVEQRAEPEAAPQAAARANWFQRLRQGLSRSSRELSGNIAGVFTKRKLDEDTLQDLEDVLIRADLGVETALRVTDALASSRYGRDVSEAEVRTVMAQEVEKVLRPVALPLELDLSHKPHVILVVGVNGTGKTTTIGKLAAKLTAGGLSVMLAAGDTFRAAAIEQLKIWGERTGSPVVASKLGADAAGLAWDAYQKAKEAGSDVLIIDTAGRLQNKAELMAELEKIVRVLGKHDPDAPHTVLQTVDATTGQNALSQVEIFRNVAGVNGLVMTKLDGTARGGILVAIAAKHRLPVYFIGVGEQVDDLEPFSAGDFAKAIAGVG